MRVPVLMSPSKLLFRWIILVARTSPLSPQSLRSHHLPNMCSYYRNYYVYSSCLNKAIHYFKTAIDGDRSRSCGKSPHERFIVVVGDCPQCR